MRLHHFPRPSSTALLVAAGLVWSAAAGLGLGAFLSYDAAPTMLYSVAGRLPFNGGITRRRGELGESAGRMRLHAALEGRGPRRGGEQGARLLAHGRGLT
jgi:hypothetical protein